MRDVLRALIAAIDAGRAVAWCRLVETRGSTPQKAGAAMLVFEDGSQAGTLGGGCVEAEVKRRAPALLAGKQAEICPIHPVSHNSWGTRPPFGRLNDVGLDPVLHGPPSVLN